MENAEGTMGLDVPIASDGCGSRGEARALRRAEELASLAASVGGRAYFVGGCVRDKLLGIESKDLDIEVHGIQPSELERIFDSMGGAAKVGESFGVYKLFDCDIDIALPRKEASTGEGHRDFEVVVDPTLGIAEAARRRDFTMNALYEDVLTGEVIDCHGGVSDLNSGVIRHVDDRTFGEDPLRALRAAQFAARFDMRIENATVDLCRSMPLSHLPSERVAEETRKALLKARRPSVYFRALRGMGQLDSWFDEVKALVGIEQNPCYHPEGDVFEHTMLVLDHAASCRARASWPLGLMVSALCHDMGKPEATFKRDDGRVVSYGHENIGVQAAKTFVGRVFHEKRLAKYVANMVKLHMRPGSLLNADAGDKSFNKMFAASICPADLCLLARADWEGSTGGEPFSTVERRLYDRLHRFEELMARPYVTGADLISAGVEPGRAMGEVLEFAHKMRLAGVSKEEALGQCLGFYRAMARSRAERDE